MNKKSNPDYILNPSSKRWVLRSGKIGKKLLSQEQQVNSKENNLDYILNPSTGKWVLRSGKIGKSLLNPQELRNVLLKDLKSINEYSNKKLQIILNKCGITVSCNSKQEMYNMLLFNKLKGCENKHDLLGNDITDIDPNKVIKINNCCYNIDTLGEYLLSSKFKNVDPYNNTNKLWKNKVEQNNLLNHPGMKELLKQKLKILEKQIILDSNAVLLGPDAPDIISYIGIVGWVCVNDNTTSYSLDPEVFKYSQKVFNNLINLINKSSNRDNWLLVQSSRGINLGSIIENISSECVHAIGFKLIGLFSYLHEESKKLGNSEIAIPPVYVSTTETVEIKGGFQNDITTKSDIRYIRVKDGRAQRSLDKLKENLQIDIINEANIIKAELLSIN